MHFNTCNPLLRTFCAFTTLLSFWIWSLASVMPVGAQAIELPLGLAAGSREAQIALDGKQWAALTSSSNPVFDGTVIRTGNGVAAALLKDGTQLELQPRSVVGISGSRTAPVVKIAVGRVLFRLPASSKIVLVTPSVRYQSATHGMPKTSGPIRVAAPNPLSPDLLGEIVVNQQGGSRIGLQQGEILASPVNDPGLHIVKAGQSVYIPQLGAHDPSFKALLVQALPGGPADEAGADVGGAGAGVGGGAGNWGVGLAVTGLTLAGAIYFASQGEEKTVAVAVAVASPSGFGP